MRTHQLEGRKREEWVGELQSMARHKRGLTHWREEEGGAGWFGLRLSHMSRDEVELEEIVKSQFHYDQLASPLVSYMSRNSPSSSLRLVSPCLQCSIFPRPPPHSSLFLSSSK